MKKIVAIFFLITYGFTTIGATIHLHYCMNKFVGAGLWHSNNNKCGKCGMIEKDKKGCCKDEHKQIKLKSDHKKETVETGFLFTVSLATLTPYTTYLFADDSITEKLPNSNAPPPKQSIPIYILNCTYRI